MGVEEPGSLDSCTELEVRDVQIMQSVIKLTTFGRDTLGLEGCGSDGFNFNLVGGGVSEMSWL